MCELALNTLENAIAYLPSIKLCPLSEIHLKPACGLPGFMQLLLDNTKRHKALRQSPYPGSTGNQMELSMTRLTHSLGTCFPVV